MTIFDSIILGIVEGLTEFLPISSTAHLVMTAHILGLEQTDFLKTFEIAIQFGAILAVVFLFWKKMIHSRALAKKVLIAFIPTGIIAFLFYNIVKNVFFESYLIIVIALVIGGVLIIFLEKSWKDHVHTKTLDTLTNTDALAIGTIQAISIIPGVSRAGATIIGGLLLGFDRKSIVEFSFLLAIPTMLVATLYDIYKNIHTFSEANISPMIIGFVVAFIAALIAIKFLLKYISKNDFTIFGVYRIIVGVGFYLLFLL